MKLSVSIPTAHAHYPLPAAAYLADFKSIEFKNAELGLRHPVGMYNVSMGTVVEAFKNAIGAASEYREAERDSKDEKECSERLERSLDHLLDATTEHFEDARSIVRVMFDEQGERAWRKALASFDSLVRVARDFPARQTNGFYPVNADTSKKADHRQKGVSCPSEESSAKSSSARLSA